MRSLEGRVAVVTGGSRGIGRAISLELAARGADVAINFLRDTESAQTTVEAIEAMGRRSVAVMANIGTQPGVDAVLAAAETLGGGRLDFVVHNAAIGAFKPTLQVRRNQWELSMSVNAHAMLALAQGARELMDGRNGRVIAISGKGARRTISDYGVVGVTKAALEALARYLARELAPAGICVNVVAAGLVETDAIRAFPDWEELVASERRRSPFGRVGRSEDISRVVAMLCGPDANWITGQVVTADGGAGLP